MKKNRGLISLFFALLFSGVAVSQSVTDVCVQRSQSLCNVQETARTINNSAVVSGMDNIAQTLATDETVRVIVTLRQPTLFKKMTTSQWQTATMRTQLHQATKLRTETVIERLGKRVRHVRSFDNFAAFACDVTSAGLTALSLDPDVVSIAHNDIVEATTRQGLSVMNALAPTRLPGIYTGKGVSIAIVDTGVDYTHPQLGGSAEQGDFPNDKVIGGYNFGDASTTDPHPLAGGGAGHAHGTCCAGTAAGVLPSTADNAGNFVGGVAPDAKIYALKITAGSTGSASFETITAAWDWCVTHKDDDAENPIMVISTSFGGGCYSDPAAVDTVFATAVTAAHNAGITICCSSGNNGYCDAISSPAIATGVIAVGAVYDANIGRVGFSLSANSCLVPSGGVYTEMATAADQVTCYSNSHAQYLDVFAPSNNNASTDIVGTNGYTTGNYTQTFGGTSSACPYAAGAVAVLQQAALALKGEYLTPAEVQSLLAQTGKMITDRVKAPMVTKPRVDLGAAIAALDPNATPANDNFAKACAFDSSTVNFEATNVNATREAGEPEHGNASIWWKYTALSDKAIVLKVASETVMPRLSVYTGTSFADLSLLAQDTTRLCIEPTTGTVYSIAVTSTDVTTGVVSLSCMPLADEVCTVNLLTPADGESVSFNESYRFSWQWVTGDPATEGVGIYFYPTLDYDDIAYIALPPNAENIDIDAATVTAIKTQLNMAADAPFYWAIGTEIKDFSSLRKCDYMSLPTVAQIAGTGVSDLKVLCDGNWTDCPNSWPANVSLPVKLFLDPTKHVLLVSHDGMEYTFDDRISADTDGSRVLGASGAAAVTNGTTATAAGYVRFSIPGGTTKTFGIVETQVPIDLSGMELQ